MIIDAVLYNGEEDMLEFRLRYLWNHVDKFIVVESDNTFSGYNKGFHDLHRFAWAKQKLRVSSLHIKSDANPWVNEANQRNAIIDSCRNFSDQDILMMGDVDEIPSHLAVDFRKANSLMYPMACDQRIIPYNLNFVREDNGWRGTVMCDMAYARLQSAQGIRDMRQRYSAFPNGGWHLTYFGTAEEIKCKIQSYSHQENNKPEYTDLDHIKNCIRTGGKLFSGNDEGYEPKIMKVDRGYYPKEFTDLTPKHWWSDYDNN